MPDDSIYGEEHGSYDIHSGVSMRVAHVASNAQAGNNYDFRCNWLLKTFVLLLFFVGKYSYF